MYLCRQDSPAGGCVATLDLVGSRFLERARRHRRFRLPGIAVLSDSAVTKTLFAGQELMNMETNPYQSPAESQSESGDHNAAARTDVARHSGVLGVLGLVSLVLAMFLTPADPYSMLLMAIPVFVVLFSVYLFGFRNGRRQSNRDAREAGNPREM